MQSAEITPSNGHRRKHRQGLTRTQIACERCRARKNKCDGKSPSCSTCMRAGAVCIITDRLNNQQVPRNHADELKSQVQALQEENDHLKAQISKLEQSQPQNLNFPSHDHSGPDCIICSGELATEIGLLSLEGASEQRYIGESSGSFFGKIVGAILPKEASTLSVQVQSSNPLRSGFGLRPEQRISKGILSTTPDPILLPTPEQADRLQEAFFDHRWPSLPFLHRPTFLKKHYKSVMQGGVQATDASLFLTYMVFAIGAIELRRNTGESSYTPLQYFGSAMSFYLSGLVEKNNLETIQGLLLLTTFAISEPRSLNAWTVSGLAMRSAIELGLHRRIESEHTFLQSEMRKRVFWVAYVLDRNISITLGRPLCIQDADINAELPLSLSDAELVSRDESLSSRQSESASTSDLSTFIHMIKLRQLGSKIQNTIYPISAGHVNDKVVHLQRDNIRAELDSWIASAPRYTTPTIAVFQSGEWFNIAFNHALLLLYRPSPSFPVPTLQTLHTCADASISLITLYLTLYSKNKFAYTWVSLHSLFIATITMLYTMTRKEIRSTTTKNITQSNVNSSLNLLGNMTELWPEAAPRCHHIVDGLGQLVMALFENDMSSEKGQISAARSAQGFGNVIRDSVDWFGSLQQVGNMPLFETSVFDSDDCQNQPSLEHSFLEPQYPLDGMMDLDGLLDFGFDFSLPLMTEAFDVNNLFS